MKPKICLCIRNIKEFSFEKSSFGGYELTTKDSNFEPNILKIIKIRDQFKGQDLSLHSQLSRIFSCNERGYSNFNEIEINILKAEILLCEFVGIKQINVHLKEGKFTKEEKLRFKKILKFATDHKVEIIYENNSQCQAEVALSILSDFPKLGYCLDFGHLNTAIYSDKLGMDLMEFIDKIKDRVVHIHAHNNDGTEDSHKNLGDGTFPWKEVLDKLQGRKLKKIIIESKSDEDIKKSKQLLEQYYLQKE